MATIFDFNTPFGMVNSQPNIGPITPMTPQPAKDRTGLATMLFALGGALKGDKDFVQKAIQLKEMKESKEKKNQQEEAWKTWKENNMDDFLSNTNIPESFKQLFDIMDAKQGLSLVTSFLPKDKDISPSMQIKQEELNVLRKLEKLNGNIDSLNNYEKLVYNNFIKRDDSQSILEQLGLLGQQNTELIIKEVKG